MVTAMKQGVVIGCLPCRGTGETLGRDDVPTECATCAGAGMDPVYRGYTCGVCACEYTAKAPRECPRCEARRVARGDV